jgi:5'-phosphate synthase pdxT subunit
LVSGQGDTSPRVGVLALQGDVAEHIGALQRLGASASEVRLPADLDAVDALVLPGGESTTLSMLIDWAGLREPLEERLAAGMPALGTCAGMILLAREVLDGRPDQRSFGAIDIAVRRNAFGRQLDSFECELAVTGLDKPLHAVFIRAPAIERIGDGVEVLATVEGVVTVAAFHPELAGDDRLHQLLLEDLARTRA